jgi:hypothetical protein
MPGPAFLFTRIDVTPGYDQARALVRANGFRTLDAAVTAAAAGANPIVRIDGQTIRLANDAVLIMIGHTSELLDELGPDDGTPITYQAVSAASNMRLYHRRKSISPIQTDTILLLGGANYWGPAAPPNFAQLGFADNNGVSRTLVLGHNDARNGFDRRMVTDLLKREKQNA